jgi:transcriptional regulator with XRE-family HTH domain
MKPVSKIDRYVIKRVRELREAKGFSQAALSYELDVSSGFIGQVESDKTSKRYTLERLNEIAKILHCSPKDFFPADSL